MVTYLPFEVSVPMSPSPITVSFTSQGRLVEHGGVVVAALVGSRPVICHVPRETLHKLSRLPRQADSLSLFREHQELLSHAVSEKAKVSGVAGEFLHVLPHELLADGPTPIA